MGIRSTNASWTAREVRILASFARFGADEVARRTGRSVAAVKHKASKLGVSLEVRPWEPGALCPRCAKNRVVEGMPGWREGLCEACHFDALAEVADARADAERARQRYARSRDHLRTARKGGSDAQG